MTNPQLVSRFRASLLGALLGDCLGSNFEGCPLSDRPNVLVFFKEVKQAKGNPKRIDQFTDDTAMARSVACSLIEKNGFDARDMANRFQSEFFKEPHRGYGGNVATVFSELRNICGSENGDSISDVYQPAREQFNGSGSYGNGGAMRIMPAALFNFNKTLKDSEQLVTDITRLTHGHQHAILGAILEHHAVLHALKLGSSSPNASVDNSPSKSPSKSTRFQKTTDEIDLLSKSLDRNAFLDSMLERMNELETETLDQNYPDFWNDSDSETKSPEKKRTKSNELMTYSSKLKAMKSMLRTDPSPKEVVDTLGHGVAAFQSVPAALYSFLRCTEPMDDIPETNPFERTIIYAVSLGGDTDTIASMAGAIAGAYYGIGAVPAYWLERCEAMEDANDQATRLYELVMAENGKVAK